MEYPFHILINLQIYIILALSLNIQVGITGLLSLSQAIFYGFGAYILTLLMTKYGFNFFLALPVAIFFNIIINGVFTTFLASQLRNLYFTLATIAIQIILYGVVYNWQSLTNGPNGLSLGRPEIFSITFTTYIQFLFLVLFFTLLTVSFFWRFSKTPIYKLLECTRDDEIWLIALGKNPIRFKFISVSISIFFATIAGALYAANNLYIDPSSFTLDESMLILTILFLGGTGNIKGSIAGALIYVLLPEILRFISIGANGRMIIYALILILVVRFKPNGLFGKLILR